MRCNKAGVFIRYSGLVLFRFSRKSEGIFMHLTPLLRNYCFFGVSPIFLTQYPVMLRDTAGEEDNSFLYFSFWGSPDEQGERLDENSSSLKR